MQIGDIVTLDQRNRLHIPYTLMKEAGIEPNSEVIINMELGSKTIMIMSKDTYNQQQALVKQVEEIFNQFQNDMASKMNGLFEDDTPEENNNDKIKVVEGQDEFI